MTWFNLRCPCEPTQFGRARAVDGAVVLAAARGADAALRVSCTALGQGGDGEEEKGGGGRETQEGMKEALSSQMPAAPAVTPALDTGSLEEFPALG